MKKIGIFTLFIALSTPLWGQSLPASNVPVTIINPAGGFTVQSVGGVGTNASTSQLGSIWGIAQTSFQTDDINLTQGSVQLMETDLRLPGRNGLDLVVVRSYSSLRYKTSPIKDPTQQRQWGLYAGNGWTFSVGMRVFVVRSNDSNQVNKVFVESMDGIEEYENGVSKQPGNFNKVSVQTTTGTLPLITDVRLKTAEGKVFVYARKFYSESYTKTINGQTSTYEISGYELSSMQDNFGNTIQYSYQEIEAEKSVAIGCLITVIGKGNTEYVSKNSYGNGQAKYTKIRLSSIVDSFGRTVTFGYGESSNQASADKDVMISSVQYTNNNGVLQKIVYSYNTYGNLTSVKVGTLPEKKYDYTYFEPRYRNFEHGHYDYYWLWKEWRADYHTVEYSPSGETTTTGVPPEQCGYLLNKVTSALGSYVSYQYEDCLTPTRDGSEGGRNIKIDYGGSTHVVIGKTVSSGTGENKQYNFNYPRDSAGYLVKGKYTPPKQNFGAFYFTSATLDNPSELEDEIYIFQNALPISRKQGINETLTEWDYEKMLKARVTTKRNGIIQTQVETLFYDPYFNSLKATTRKGASLTDFLLQEMSYYTSSSTDAILLDQNLIHLPKMSKTTDLATNKVRSNFVTYTDKGKPYQTYEGMDATGVKKSESTYDTQGRLISSTQYSADGSAKTQTISYPGETVSEYQVQVLNNGKTQTTVYEKNTGKLKKSIDTNGNITTYTFDDYGRPLTTIYPNGQQSSTQYSIDLKMTTLTSGGRTVKTTVDNFGRIILVDCPDGEEDIKTEYYLGDAVSKVYVLQGGSWVQKKSFTYDTLLRKLTSTTVGFGTVTYQYDSPGLNSITVTDPLGRKTQATGDELGRVVEKRFIATDPSTGATVTQITTSTYDGFGNMVTVTDPRGLTHKIDYDAYGRPIQTYFTGSYSAKIRNKPTYAPNGQVTGTLAYDKSGSLYRTYSYKYDPEGRLNELWLNGIKKETLTYDSGTNGKDALTGADTPDATTGYEYDTMGRITKETTLIKAVSKTISMTYGYNTTNGNIETQTFQDGKAIQYTYDTNQRVKTISFNGKLLVTYTYNSNGTIQNMTYGNGTKINYGYNREVLLNSIQALTAQNAVLYSQTYTLDTLGKTTQTQHNNYITGGSSLTRDYGYSAKDELKTVKLNSNPQYTHNYDSNGNHLRFETLHNKGLSADNMSVDPDFDQITEKRHGDGKKIQMTYDAEGNMATRKAIYADGTYAEDWTLNFNYQGQLQEIKDSGLTEGIYGYDHKRQRVYSYMPDAKYPTKFYYYDQAGRVIAEGVPGESDFVVRYIYSGNEKVAMERRDMNTGVYSFYYFINNAQGTPVLIVDESNTAVSKVNLDEWGNFGMVIGPIEEINYTGKKRDVTGLYYFGQRYYDPELGRFISEDPAAQLLNPYVYAGNNPLMYADPDGEWFFSALLSVFGPLGTMIGGALDAAAWAGTTSAAINAGSQYVMTGSVNMGSVWNSFGSGALSGALSFGIGEMMGHATEGLGKTLAHGVSGGLQSMANGGNFGSGFIGGAIGNMAGEASKGMGMWEQAGIAGLAAGTTSWASGGDFATGFQSGAYNVLWNQNGKGMLAGIQGWFESLVPRYGNWGGPGWSGGNVKPLKNPVDSMDELFKIHDTAYLNKQNAVGDIQLLRGLESLSPNSLIWRQPASNPAKANNYRSLATDYFRLKLLLQTGQVY